MKRHFFQKTFIFFLISLLIVPALALAGPDLNVEFSADPNSGPAPLENVDLTAIVSGTATGPITYKFDCTADGSWDYTVTTNSTSYTATDLCDYPTPGNYIAKVSVERGGLFFEGTTAIMVNGGGELSVILSANPSAGTAPLENVDLEATISGTADGSITYRFDCTSDGTWEKVYTTNTSSYTAEDLCDYEDPGNYTAKVKVERSGLSFEGTTAIYVFESNSSNPGNEQSAQVIKMVRNITKGENEWQTKTSASPNDLIEFRIQVRNTGNKAIQEATLSDILPAQMTYQGNLKRNGNSISGDIRDGISLGTLEPNETETVTFKAKVNGPESFLLGTTSITNIAVLKGANGFVRVGMVKVEVQKTAVLGAATSVSTGIMDQLALLMGVLFAVSVVLYLVWLRLTYVQNAFVKGFVRKAHLWVSFVIPR